MRNSFGQMDIIMSGGPIDGNALTPLTGIPLTERRRLELKPEPGTEPAIERFAAAIDPDHHDTSFQPGQFIGDTLEIHGSLQDDPSGGREHSADFLTESTSEESPTSSPRSDAEPLFRSTPAEDTTSPHNLSSLSASSPSNDSADTSAAMFVCPSCGENVPASLAAENGLVECPACKAQFFGVAEMSAEDREQAREMELQRELAEQRLGDLHRNAVLLERRSLYRTRSYLMIGFVVSLAAVLQAGGYAYRRWVRQDWTWQTWAFFATISGALLLARFCYRKIREINAELAIPVQQDPTTPPDFSTLSDGSQVQETMAKNLERLGGG